MTGRKMQAVVKTAAGKGAVLREADIPRPGPEEVLVKVEATSICGTDVHIYNWDSWAAARIRPPLIFGHEFAGRVVEIGEAVKGFGEGDFVSAECHKTCGLCFQCRTGRAHVCRHYTILGVDFPGSFAEYVVVPGNCLWRNDPSLSPEIACLQDPLGNAVMAALAGEIAGRTAAVLGCGPLGLLGVAVCRAVGAGQVYAVEPNAYRLELALRLGATAGFDPARGDVAAEVVAATGGEGVDAVLEMSGSPRALHDALAMVKNGGWVSLLGIPAGPVELDLANEVIFKGVTLHGITGRKLFETWYRVAALLQGGLEIAPVLTHRFRLAEFEQAFAVMNAKHCGKVVMCP